MENSWPSRAAKPRGKWVIPIVARVGPPALKEGHKFTIWWARFRRDWPSLTCRGGTRGLDYSTYSSPSPLTCWLALPRPKAVRHSPAYQRSSKEVHSHLESVLLTVSEWEQAVGGERRRVRGGKLHRDFFFFSPVTNRQFTPQRIWNQNLIKILNK